MVWTSRLPCTCHQATTRSGTGAFPAFCEHLLTCCLLSHVWNTCTSSCCCWTAGRNEVHVTIRPSSASLWQYTRSADVQTRAHCDFCSQVCLPRGVQIQGEGFRSKPSASMGRAALHCVVSSTKADMFGPQDAAGQLRSSPHQFSNIGAMSPLLFLARGCVHPGCVSGPRCEQSSTEAQQCRMQISCFNDTNGQQRSITAVHTRSFLRASVMFGQGPSSFAPTFSGERMWFVSA